MRVLVAALVLLALGAAPPRAEAARFGYDPERGAFIASEDGRWELNPYAMIQLRGGQDLQAGQPTATSLSVHAAKLILHGHIFSPTLIYHFQINAGEGQVVPEDIYLRWQPLPWLGLLAGQIEVTYNRQHITLEAYQQLVERSLVDGRFNLRRSPGLAAYVSSRDHVVEWTSGAWMKTSSASAPQAAGATPGYVLTTRLAWSPFGPIPFREADLALSRSPRLSVAVAGAYDPGGALQGVAELTLRHRGVSLSAEGHLRRRSDDAGTALDYGAFVQAGLFVLPPRLELEARYAFLAGALAPKDVRRELTAGASYYLHGHRLKLQASYSLLTSALGEDKHRALAQLEFFL